MTALPKYVVDEPVAAVEDVAVARVFEAKPAKNAPNYVEMRERAKARFAKTLAYLGK